MSEYAVLPVLLLLALHPLQRITQGFLNLYFSFTNFYRMNIAMNNLAAKSTSRPIFDTRFIQASSMSFLQNNLRSGAYRMLAPLQAIASVLCVGLLLASCGDDASLDTSGLFTYDEARPMVTISGPDFTNANVESTSLQYKILIDNTVQEALSASDPNSISVTNATITSFSQIDLVNFDEYLLAIQPDPESTAGEIVITVLEGAVTAQIGEGYFPNKAESFTVIYDNVAPNVDITVEESVDKVFLVEEGAADVSSDDHYVVNGDFSVLLRFDEEVTGLTASDIDFSVAGVGVANTVALNGGLTHRVDIELADSSILADNTDIVLTLSADAVEDLSGIKTEAELDEYNISGYAEVAGYTNTQIGIFNNPRSLHASRPRQ